LGWRDREVPDRVLVEQRQTRLWKLVNAVGQAAQPGLSGKDVKSVHFVGFGYESDSDHRNNDLVRKVAVEIAKVNMNQPVRKLEKRSQSMKTRLLILSEFTLAFTLALVLAPSAALPQAPAYRASSLGMRRPDAVPLAARLSHGSGMANSAPSSATSQNIDEGEKYKFVRKWGAQAPARTFDFPERGLLKSFRRR
jgi:hypothetical protein